MGDCGAAKVFLIGNVDGEVKKLVEGALPVVNKEGSNNSVELEVGAGTGVSGGAFKDMEGVELEENRFVFVEEEMGTRGDSNITGLGKLGEDVTEVEGMDPLDTFNEDCGELVELEAPEKSSSNTFLLSLTAGAGLN